MSKRNDVYLVANLDGELVSHFKLKEFENRDGLAIVHQSTLESLERVRADLCAMAGEEVWLIITDAVRTQADNERLGARLGWTDEGGAVSRHSRHLVEYGGIAVDLKAFLARKRPGCIYRERIPQATLGEVCLRHFDFVKDDYSDGHVHADNREQED